MAHTIRAVTNQFAKHLIDLDIRVIADTYSAIQLQAPAQGATSLLRTRLRPRANQMERDRVTAFIYIHKDANKHLARVCIAHELYHLMLEQNAYLAGGRTAWSRINPDKPMEDQCSQFAWQLCFFHDKFNHDEALKKKHVYFPPGMFDAPLKTNNINNHLVWPAGIALDPVHPFYKAEDPDWLNN
jgi:Zn-dependent peptidase ImmA (M78 family)